MQFNIFITAELVNADECGYPRDVYHKYVCKVDADTSEEASELAVTAIQLAQKPVTADKPKDTLGYPGGLPF